MTFPVTRFRSLFADDKSIYGARATGELLWHPGWTDTATPPTLADGAQIGIEWADFSHLVAGGGGIIYALTAAGELRWYCDTRRDGTNASDGSTGWASGSGTTIRTGLSDVVHLLSGDDGVLYAITSAGELIFYRDCARDGSNAPDGTSGWAPGSGNQIDAGWSAFRHVVSGGGGVIYAVTERGDLLWYRDDARDGTNGPRGSSGWAAASRSRVGGGWDFFLHVFAGEAGVLIACPAREYGPRLRRYRDRRRDGSNGVAGKDWLVTPEESGGGWQVAAIEGYCWPPGAAPGERIRFHVSSMTPGSGAIEFVRLAGRGPRMGLPLTRRAEFACDFRAAGSFDTDCGWPVSFELEVPEWEEGFYAGRVRGPQGAVYDIPFVVKRGPSPLADLALLVNVNTWNAYNTWGGASNYTKTMSPITLTLKRPNHHLLSFSQDHGAGSHMLRSEIWLHSWLRAHGYGVDLYTDLDLERGPEGFESYKALVLNTHPEYWTQTMIARVRSYLGAGNSILYLGGNAMYRPTTLMAEQDGGTLDQTITESEQWDEYPTYEGKPLLAARVENLGYFIAASERGRGLVVSDPDHRFMPGALEAGTSVLGKDGWNGDPPFGASGWETDCWAAPLPDDVSELARDTNKDELGATIACYETAAGGFVLGTAAITFVGSLMVDSNLQQIVHSALAEALSKA
jgi:N,N-dimethylformamidase